MPTSETENTTVYQTAEKIAYGPYVTFDSSTYTIHNPWEPNNNACTSVNNDWAPVPDYNQWKDKLKEYCSSTDKHLDDLEEDIDFLDRERKNMNGDLSIHEDKINDLESKLDLLKNENALLRTALEDLQNQIYTLHEKLDNQ